MDINDGRHLTFDVECFNNYFLLMVRRVSDGKVKYFEKFNDSQLDILGIRELFSRFTFISFNGNKYDRPVIDAALAGCSNRVIKRVSDRLIESDAQPWEVRRNYDLDELKFRHIDIEPICPLMASLKIYAGRIGVSEMMDLPLCPNSTVTQEMRDDLIHYCELDNRNTAEIAKELGHQLNLREFMSGTYDMDLRSKSDAQAAEAVVKSELLKRFNVDARAPEIESGSTFNYVAPSNITFKTDTLKELLHTYCNEPITITESGKCELVFNSEEISKLTDEDYDAYISAKRLKTLPGFEKWVGSKKKKKKKFNIGSSTYTVGVGGMHSNEKSTFHISDEKYIVREIDVAAFYPNIILNNKLCPKHIGEAFLHIYEGLIKQRLEAKHNLKTLDPVEDAEEYAKNDAINNSIKIFINGLFGKLGSKWSGVYSPDLMAQVTITGQLSLLMLIERLELAGISVVSANTDGIVLKIARDKIDECEGIVKHWEHVTNYTMEVTDYSAIYSRDVNNYVAVLNKSAETDKPYSDKAYGIKGKGAYCDQYSSFYRLRNNPSVEICKDAVKVFLKTGVPIEKTIRECDDIGKFVSVRKVTGGAIKDGEFVGKAIRVYYGQYELDAIYNAKNGNKVPLSEGAIPIMYMDGTMPDDIDYDWYIAEAYKKLDALGCRATH